MFSIAAGRTGMQFCDGYSRRDFLRIGTLGVGGLTLGNLLRAEAEAGIGSSHKAIVNIHLSGGPSHMDMFDLKPEAPSEFRGEFAPIQTNVEDMHICQHFPGLAQQADKFAVIRTLEGNISDHSDFPTQVGYPRQALSGIGGRPSMGSVVSKLQGSAGTGAPSYVSFSGSYAGYLGATHVPFKPRGGELRLNPQLTADRLGTRTSLLQSLDTLRREVDANGTMKALDSYTQQAVDMVTSGRVADALDLNKEDPRLRDRYGNDGKTLLTARRLIEAGVRVVSLTWGSWDTHSNNFGHLSGQLPRLDRILSTFLNDLHQRSLDQDVTVVMWGEFGRTPRINNNKAGRDHWERVASCFLAGGGMQMGQMIGRTNRNGERSIDRPVHLQEVFATLYHRMGIDVKTTTLIDPAGRPQYLVDHREPIRELI